jgi:protein TonB
MIARYGIGLVLGLLVTAGLFFMMQALIKSDRNPLTEGVKGKLVDFVMLPEDQDVQIKDRKPKPPPPPQEPPPNMPKPTFDSSTATQGVAIGQVNAKVDLNIQGTGGFTSDGEYLPIVKVAPVYPRRAQQRGITGYVLLEFTVTENGSVKDPVVIDSQPQGVFDNAAIQAALKFKYKPKVVDGQPVSVSGVRNLIKFELEDG